MRRKGLASLLVLLAIAGAGGAYYAMRPSGAEPEILTARVTRGDVVDTVGATGTLQAVTTVQVGTQVSGTIRELSADFNSIVRKGQVVARLDPSLFQTQIEQSRANLIRAEADVERLRVALEDTRDKLKRAKELSTRNLIPAIELDAAAVAVKSAEAQLRSAQAQVTQARASLNQSEVNHQHTVITAPIDGIVISRNVDIGQTVAASMQAPTLFVIAADLTKMQVNANVDESDVGRIRPGQTVRFRVDAYPTDEFFGTVSQVRLQPTVVQNVVTYATVIDVPNLDLRLKPGMTANVNVEIARKADVLRVPNAALRFRPNEEIFQALNQTPPEMPGRGRGPGAGGREPGTLDPSGANPSGSPRGPERPAPQVPAPRGTSGVVDDLLSEQQEQGRPQGERGRSGFDPERMRERMQQMSPEERERFLQRMRERGMDPSRFGFRPDPETPAAPGKPAAPKTPPEKAKPAAAPGTIDSLFGPLPEVETSGVVWRFMNRQLKPVRLRLGISDGTNTELRDGDLQVGTEVVTSVILAGAQNTAGPAGRSPLMPGRPGFGPGGRPGGPGGGGSGGGRR